MDTQKRNLGLERWIAVSQAIGSENQAKDFLHGDKQADGGDQGHIRRAIQDGLVAETVHEHARNADNNG